MHTISCIKRFISGLGDGQIFGTRDVLRFGTRPAVDKAMQRLVATDWVRRLARGVFIKDPLGKHKPSMTVVAQVKARLFRRRIIKPVSKQLAEVCGLNAYDKIAFPTDGHTSSFLYGKTRIYYRRIARRRFVLGETPLGEALRALWDIGKYAVGFDLERQVMQHLGGQIIDQEMKDKIRYLPAWLSWFYLERQRAKRLRPVPIQPELSGPWW